MNIVYFKRIYFILNIYGALGIIRLSPGDVE